MKTFRTAALLTVAFAVSLAGQAVSQTEARAESCTRHCNRVPLPLGLYVTEVNDGGSYVTLEDGSSWEIRLPDRPTASSWQPGDFVELKRIWAPVDRYEILLAHGDRDEAAARFAGRKPLAQAGVQ